MRLCYSLIYYPITSEEPNDSDVRTFVNQLFIEYLKETK